MLPTIKNGRVELPICCRLGKSLGKSEIGLVLGHSAGGLRRDSAREKAPVFTGICRRKHFGIYPNCTGLKEWCPRQDLNLYDVTH